MSDRRCHRSANSQCQPIDDAHLRHRQRQAKVWHWDRVSIDCIGAAGSLVALDVVAHDLQNMHKSGEQSIINFGMILGDQLPY